jgi:putative membrane protein
MQTLARGALAGLAATVPMTAVIGAGRAAGLMRTPPPVEITENVAEQAGENPDRQSPQFQAASLAAHAGYGAACGVIFAAIRPVLPRSDLAAGLLFGGAVWGVSYISLMPSLNLYPSAQDDSTQRQAVMIAAHAVFGTVLASLERHLRAEM